MTTVPTWAWRALVLAVVLGSAIAVLRLTSAGDWWRRRVRTRLILGLPVGTLLSVLFLLSVYLVLQNGLGHWSDPTVIPYRAWSYLYPLGMLTAPFAHNGPNHLVSNLLGTLTLGVLAEYAWSHFPTRRGQHSFGSLRTNPYARAFGFFLAVVLVGLLTSLFSLGPIVGFSGVVFAFAGLAVVRYPVTSILALIAADLIGLVYRGLQSPETVTRAGSEFVEPWFADVAIQGHYVGFLLGVIVGVLLVRRRDVLPPAGRIWFAALAFGADQALWALYAPRGEGAFVLLRAGGVVVLFVLAALVTAGALSSERHLVARIDLTRHEAVVGLLAAVFLATAAVAVPFNVLTVGGADVSDHSIEVRDYTVFYAENTPHRLVSAIDASALGEDTQVNVSGVIVTSDRRSVWWPVVSADRLAARHRATVVLGGPGWRTPVHVTRPSWRVSGGDVAYSVSLQPADGTRRLAFRSPPARADASVAGRNVSITPSQTGFTVAVTRDGETLGQAALPESNGTTRVGGLAVERQGRTLFVGRNDTRVAVARRGGTD